MKKLLLFLILPLLFGATYYAATDGSGNFTNLTQVNAGHSGGDTVLFKAGDTFRGQLVPISGTAGSPTVYGSYGSGTKPLILGSEQENSAGDWVDQTGNIWANNDTAFTVDVGNIIFDNETSCGVKVKNETDLNTQDEFWYNFTTDTVKIYSVGNPASVHTNIECALKNNIIEQGSKNNITYSNLDLRYGGVHGIGGGNTNDISISDMDISFLGGCDQMGNYSTRYGNGIELWQNSSNVLVERCKLSNIYDAALTNQGTTYETQHNITFRNNIIDKAEYSYESFAINASSVITNVSFIHNTCSNAGSGWGHSQRWDSANGRHLMLGFNNGDIDISIKNNIFDTWTQTAIRFNQETDIPKYTLDYNLYYNNGVQSLVNCNDLYYSNLTNWQVASQDAHSIASDPLLSSRYRLMPGSPAINAGADLNVATDYLGNSRDDSPSLGAMEAGNHFRNAQLYNGTVN